MNQFQGGNDALFDDPVLLALVGCGGEKSETVSKTEYGEKWPFIPEQVDLLCEEGPPSALENTRREALRAEWERAVEGLEEWLARWAIAYQAKRKSAWYHNGLQRNHRARHETLSFLRWIEPPARLPLVDG